MPYFHIVFTLPGEIGPLALQNKRLVYALLFRAVAETLRQLAADPKHLGAEIGFLAVLHTWGQNLHHHPHIHCVIPAGGISPDEKRWIACRDNFFLPVRVLARLFRGKFLAYLQEAFDAGNLGFHGRIEQLANTSRWQIFLGALRSKEWVVYVKPPFGGSLQVLKYLARYTHRVAISNHRLVSLQGGKVTFRYKDYTQEYQQRTMTLGAVEFIRRFLLHLLPKKFVHIRYFGFLSNGHRNKKLQRARTLLGSNHSTEPMDDQATPQQLSPSSENPTPELCPSCKQGRLICIEIIYPTAAFKALPWLPDT